MKIQISILTTKLIWQMIYISCVYLILVINPCLIFHGIHNAHRVGGSEALSHTWAPREKLPMDELPGHRLLVWGSTETQFGVKLWIPSIAFLGRCGDGYQSFYWNKLCEMSPMVRFFKREAMNRPVSRCTYLFAHHLRETYTIKPRPTFHQARTT